MDYPKQVTVIEVGPRDGLQNESSFVSSEQKIALINILSHTGLKHIEVTSFVSPKAIPQLADNETVFSSIDKIDGVHYSALVPNERGMNKALEVGAKEHHIKVRGYISCVLGCPYEGAIKPQKVSELTQKLLDLGVDEISLGDTIGVGTPKQTQLVLDAVLKIIPIEQLAMHFHDTYGQAVANIYASLAHGVHRFDSSVAGLGGCPYARGASGNVATEDLLYLMHGLGIDTGVDIFKVVNAGDMICKALQRKNQSKVANALLANPCNENKQ